MGVGNMSSSFTLAISRSSDDRCKASQQEGARAIDSHESTAGESRQWAIYLSIQACFSFLTLLAASSSIWLLLLCQNS